MEEVTRQNAAQAEDAVTAAQSLQDAAASLARTVSLFTFSNVRLAYSAPAIRVLEAEPVSA